MPNRYLESELREIHAQLPTALEFPIKDAADFTSKIPDGQYTFRNKPVDRVKAMARMPADIFPIKSMRDFDEKMLRLIEARDSEKQAQRKKI